MEELVSGDIWRGRRVFITGHTGFKGSWLALWLADLGAEVTGFALPPPAGPSLFEAARVEELVHHVVGDVRDADDVARAVAEAQPEIVFHLAAQALVRQSYVAPVETYAVNVMGTVHVLEACRGVASLRGVVAITSDKCYENQEWVWPYRETDPMGGHDPYSSSKGAAELVITAYRRSFFEHGAGIASVRAGNVIGGGDWAADRLIPDLIRALLAGRRPLIRAPAAVRPWQHVLEALSGYILIAERLVAGDRSVGTGWNFGPANDDTKPVSWLVERLLERWGAEGWDRPEGEQPHEATLLSLDCAKARRELGWRPSMRLAGALDQVVAWHQSVAAGADARMVTLDQLRTYRTAMRSQPTETTRWD